MTVYELIQELSRYNADTMVKFHADMVLDVCAQNLIDQIDLEKDQYVKIVVDNDADYDGINGKWEPEEIIINLKY